MDLSTILTQMGILVIIMFVGFLCARLKITGPAFNKAASGLVMNVMLSATILSSALQTDLVLHASELLLLIFVPFVILFIGLVLGLVTPRLLRIRGDDAGLVAFMLMFMNSVFVAFPVIESIYGATGVVYASLSNVAYNLMAYTVGIALVQGGGKGTMRLKSVINPPLVSTVLAVLILLFKIHMPLVVVKALSTIAQGTIPMSMIVIGTSLGGVSITAALKDWRLYAISLLRLIAVPVLVWAVLRLFVTDAMMLGVFVILASAPVALITTIFAIQYGKNEGLASQSIFISTVLSAVTMPLVIYLLL